MSTKFQEIVESLKDLDDSALSEVQHFINSTLKLTATPNPAPPAQAYPRLPDRPPGMTGEQFVALARELAFDPEDLKLMQQAIEEEFRRIPPPEDNDRINLDER
jgi:hypothetical protein